MLYMGNHVRVLLFIILCTVHKQSIEMRGDKKCKLLGQEEKIQRFLFSKNMRKIKQTLKDAFLLFL